MTHTLRLDAARAGTPPTDADDETRRVRRVRLVPYGGQVGRTSAGPVTASRGVIDLPADPSWVKLVDEHTDPPTSIGSLVELEDTDEALYGRVRFARTPAGDAALLELEEGARDGFSVELDDVTLDRGRLVAAALTAVAFVTTPAWSNARSLAASRRRRTEDEKGTRMTTMTGEARARLAELAAADSLTDDELDELRDLAAAAASADPETAPADPETTAADPDPAPVEPGSLAASRPAAIPTGAHRRTRRGTAGRQLPELYASLARVLSGRSRPELEAALSDITGTANLWTGQDEYAGQLWSGLDYVRRFVPLMAPGTLTSYKGTGWRWVVKPEVDDYAGDKTAVPSNAATTEETEWTAARLAGAHDLDRKFWDFGDTAFIEAYYAAMRESYARQSDNKARAFLIANATDTGVADAASLFHAAAVAADAVDTATGGATVDYFLVNAGDKLALMDVTADAIPAYLEAFGVTPDKFITAAGVTAGTVIAGNRASTKFRELSGSPIRVEAIDVANGGVDGGVFGYYATELLVAGGVSSAAFV